MDSRPLDQYQRPLRDLRVSLTDRCNFRCSYCMPAEVFGPGFHFLGEEETLSLPELQRVFTAFVQLGVEKVRLTGGEPLLRQDLAEIISFLKRDLKVPDVAVTTNGVLLKKSAAALGTAGLDRVNVSFDSHRPETFSKMNGARGSSPKLILEGIDAALSEGIPVKINMVVQRGVNDGEIVEVAGLFRERKIPVRFIEFMDVGNSNGWTTDQVVPAREVVERINAVWPLTAVGQAYRGEVARRYQYEDGSGEIGIISSITEPFCKDCHRARLSADGKLFTCLFATKGWDIRKALRNGANDDELRASLAEVWNGRKDRYSDERNTTLGASSREKIEMSYIGG